MSNAGRYAASFSFYGGKSKLAHLYPTPRHKRIVEPFAGAAAYSLRHYEHEVLLADIDDVVASMWHFLLSPDALTWVRQLPDTVEAGAIIDDVVGQVPYGLLGIVRAESNHGTQGAKGIHRQVTRFGAACWHRLKPRLEFWIPRIRHWRFVQASWESLEDIEATWFVDPPYNNAAGRRYRHADINYAALAKWCLTRRGQVIVCENEGADWLPFVPLVNRRGIRSSYQRSNTKEVVWVRDDSEGGKDRGTTADE